MAAQGQMEAMQGGMQGQGMMNPGMMPMQGGMMNPGMMPMQGGMNPGMMPMQGGMNPGMQGMQGGMNPTMTPPQNPAPEEGGDTESSDSTSSEDPGEMKVTPYSVSVHHIFRWTMMAFAFVHGGLLIGLSNRAVPEFASSLVTISYFLLFYYLATVGIVGWKLYSRSFKMSLGAALGMAGLSLLLWLLADTSKTLGAGYGYTAGFLALLAWLSGFFMHAVVRNEDEKLPIPVAMQRAIRAAGAAGRAAGAAGMAARNALYNNPKVAAWRAVHQ